MNQALIQFLFEEQVLDDTTQRKWSCIIFTFSQKTVEGKGLTLLRYPLDRPKELLLKRANSVRTNEREQVLVFSLITVRATRNCSKTWNYLNWSSEGMMIQKWIRISIHGQSSDEAYILLNATLILLRTFSNLNDTGFRSSKDEYRIEKILRFVLSQSEFGDETVENEPRRDAYRYQWLRR